MQNIFSTALVLLQKADKKVSRGFDYGVEDLSTNLAEISFSVQKIGSSNLHGAGISQS